MRCTHFPSHLTYVNALPCKQICSKLLLTEYSRPNRVRVELNRIKLNRVWPKVMRHVPRRMEVIKEQSTQ